MWPFTKKTEIRQSSGFGDLVLGAIVANANGTLTGSPLELGVLEIASGFYARCFASAVIEPQTPTTRFLTPSFLARVARDCLRRGESLSYLEVKKGMVKAYPAGSWDLRGGWDEESWFYRLDLFGPSGNTTKLVPSASVLHFRYSVDPSRPFLGVSPLGWSKSTASLASFLETRIGQEISGPVGSLLPTPTGPVGEGDTGEDDPLGQLQKDISGLKGQSVLVETVAGGWSEGQSHAPQSDWQAKRIGANPPATLSMLRSEAAKTILSACGIPPSLYAEGGSSQGQREAFRQAVHSGVMPLARLIEAELSDKLDTTVTMNFSALQAHNLNERASAFAKYVQGGMSVADAKEVIMLEEIFHAE